MTDPIRLCDAIAALLPALRPAPIPGAGHRPVMRAVICRASAEVGRPPITAAFQAVAPGPAPLPPARKAASSVPLGGPLLPVIRANERGNME